jgi:8-oxo-dGTP pyrophosphatase MutT (NUDIX family)
VTIVGATLLYLDERQRMLFVETPKNPGYLIHPGGTHREGESIEQTLLRELEEELGCYPDGPRLLGRVRGTTVEGLELVLHLFTVERLVGALRPRSEVQRLVYLSKTEALTSEASRMTPITRAEIWPFLEKQHFW